MVMTVRRRKLATSIAIVEPISASPNPEVKIIQHAAGIIGVDRIAKWMNTPLPALKGRTPFSLLDTEEGREKIEEVLGKIDYGVYG
jgi:uncharacterized protein (DUF2384 family)